MDELEQSTTVTALRCIQWPTQVWVVVWVHSVPAYSATSGPCAALTTTARNSVLAHVSSRINGNCANGCWKADDRSGSCECALERQSAMKMWIFWPYRHVKSTVLQNQFRLFAGRAIFAVVLHVSRWLLLLDTCTSTQIVLCQIVDFHSTDFPSEYQNWTTVDPLTLFNAPTVKNESNPKVCVMQIPNSHWCRRMCVSICNMKHAQLTILFYGWIVIRKAKIFVMKSWRMLCLTWRVNLKCCAQDFLVFGHSYHHN